MRREVELRRLLKLALQKTKATRGRPFTYPPAVCQPVGAAASTSTFTSDASDAGAMEINHDDFADIAIDEYRHARAGDAGDAAAASQVYIAPGFSQEQYDSDMKREMAWEKEFAHDWEQEREVNEPPDDRRWKIAEPPAVVTRGSIDRSRYMCHCCGKRSACDLQMPDDVFNVAYTVDGPAGAIRALKAFAEMLTSKDFEGAVSRTCCCRQLECMLAQGKLTPENYEAWRFSGKKDEKTGEAIEAPRNQLERGTERMDQGVIFSDNILLLRWIFMLRDGKGEAVLSAEEIRELFHWVVLNARFIQEREMRYIATAMAIVESGDFPFKFADAQAFVNQMAGVARTYVARRLLAHIFDTELDKNRWKSKGIRLLETAFPKAADTAYLLMCRANWIAQGKPYHDGRPAHRVAAGALHAVLFTAPGFSSALQAATTENPTYSLRYASSTVTPNSVKGCKAQTREATRELIKAVSGSRRSGALKANGVQGRKCAPTDGARQSDSSVHTAQRYDGACEGLGFDQQEKAETLALMIDEHRKGNSVGKEKLQGVNADRTKSKACAVLRPVEVYTPPEVRPVSRKAAIIKRARMWEKVALKKRNKVELVPGIC